MRLLSNDINTFIDRHNTTELTIIEHEMRTEYGYGTFDIGQKRSIPTNIESSSSPKNSMRNNDHDGNENSNNTQLC